MSMMKNRNPLKEQEILKRKPTLPPKSKFKSRMISSCDKENVDRSQCQPQLYQPRRRNGLGLNHNTVSMVIHESEKSHEELLNSLLYGEASESEGMGGCEQVPEDDDELLMDCCVNEDGLNKLTKAMTPVKTEETTDIKSTIRIKISPIIQNSLEEFPSICEEHLSQSRFLIAKEGCSFVLVFNKIEREAGEFTEEKELEGALVRRLKSHFHENSEHFLSLFHKIYQCYSEAELIASLRQYLFENNIFFNKSDLNELVELMMTGGSRIKIWSAQMIGETLEAIFMDFQYFDDWSSTRNISIYDQRIRQWPEWTSGTIPIWKFLQQVYEVTKKDALDCSVMLVHERSFSSSLCVNSSRSFLEVSRVKPGSKSVSEQISKTISQWMKHFLEDRPQEDKSFTIKFRNDSQ